jgi:phage I-like protein
MQKGLTPKEAYNALFGETRAARMSEAAKEAAAEQQRIKDSKKIKGLSQKGNGAAADSTYGLTPDEIAVAKATGMSLKDYAMYKKKD